MITNFAEIVKSQGWHQGQMVETDIWMGEENIRHFNRVMVINDQVLYGEVDKIVYVGENPKARETEEARSFNYGTCQHLVKAHTFAEVKNDIETMLSINNELYEKMENKTTKDFDRILSQLNTLYNDNGWSMMNRIVKKYNHLDNNKYEGAVNILHLLGFYHEEYDSNEVISKMASIVRNQGFWFKDSENHGIRTFIKIDHISSVETDCEYDEKECVSIHMDNGKNYFVFKRDDEDIYKAIYEIFS